MALFKIFKGSKDNLGQAPGTGLQDTRQTHEGFAYFTPEDGKFYIDIADSNSAVVGTNRIPISADKADKDASGNVITSTYLTKAAGVTNVAWNSTNKKLTKTINGSTTDVVTIGTIKTALALAKSDVGLGNVANIDQSKAIKSITRSGTTFTYTCLDDTTGTFTQRDTATAADNILDGSNSGTQITYAPYTSQQQSKLSFDTSTDFPIGTDRLNLNGILYATGFQVEHKSGGQQEYRVTYGSSESSVDMSMMIGTGNENHGLYDHIAGKWMIVADGSGNVKVNGNATTATNVAWSGVTGKPSSFTPSSHTHGNITNAGAITATQTIANGDKIVIVDSSDSSKITGTTITFDGSTATKALTQKGTWETFNNYSLPTASSSTLGGIKIGTGLNINSGVVNVNIADLGLSSAMHFIGVTTTSIEDGDGHKDSYAGISGYTEETPGDVILYNDAEFVWTGNYWELLGDKGSFKVVQTPVTTATEETDTATTFVHSVTQDANGNITVKTRPLPTYNNYSLPLAASGTRGGIQIGYSENGKNYPVELSNEKAYVNVPWTDTKNTAGSTDTSSKIFLIGATSQAANPQTYSDDQVFTTSGVLTAKELVLSTTGARSITFSRTDGYNYIQTPVGGGVAICATDDSVSLIGSTLLVNATNVKPGKTDTYDLGTSSNKWKAAYVTTLNSDDIIVDNLTASQAVSTDANKKLVSTNLTVSDPTASGTGITYIATISQSAVGKITVTKSTVRGASTSQTGVVQLSSATNSTDETLAATAKAVKTAYDLANTANTTANSHKYWANIESTSAAAYNKTPEVASIKINGDTSASAASTKNVQLTYDSADDSINFNFI